MFVGRGFSHDISPGISERLQPLTSEFASCHTDSEARRYAGCYRAGVGARGLLGGRHAALEFFGPVEDDVDLGEGGSLRLFLGLEHEETLAVG